MATATHTNPANEPARRRYAHVVVPPHRRRTRLDNASLREAVKQYTGIHLKGYTKEGLRNRFRMPQGAALSWFDGYDNWVRRELKRVGLEEPAAEDAAERAKDAVIAEHGPIEEWNVSRVTDMRYLFKETDFNDDLSNWDVSSVTDMFGMFQRARAFNGNLSTWDTSKVTQMRYMFLDAKSFNGDLSAWDVSKVTDMNTMFYGACLFNGDLSKWDVSKVTDMRSMFGGTKSFNGDLSKWDVSNVRHANGMFCGADIFDGAMPLEFLKALVYNRDPFGLSAHFQEPRLLPAAKYGRWLWRLAREGVRPHVLARLAAYHLMELGARPDAEGNAPRGAIEAFCDDF